MPKIGIIQGRLVQPWNGQLQCWPRDHWQDEPALAREAGLDAIELFVEKDDNPLNPVWTEEGRAQLRSLSERWSIGLDTLCADCFMTRTFLHEPAEASALLEQLMGCGFERIVLPFFEHAELRTDQDIARAGAALRPFAGRGVELALETSLRPAQLTALLDAAGATVCYDTGNTTALGHEIAGDILQLAGRITHVHVKDKRRADGANVQLGTGDSDLAGAFASLRKIGYAGDYSLETHRGDDPIRTAQGGRELVMGYLS